MFSIPPPIGTPTCLLLLFNSIYSHPIIKTYKQVSVGPFLPVAIYWLYFSSRRLVYQRGTKTVHCRRRRQDNLQRFCPYVLFRWYFGARRFVGKDKSITLHFIGYWCLACSTRANEEASYKLVTQWDHGQIAARTNQVWYEEYGLIDTQWRHRDED